jgi:sulfur-oxidizing protein SoxA
LWLRLSLTLLLIIFTAGCQPDGLQSDSTADSTDVTDTARIRRLDQPVSGLAFQSEDTQRLQADEFANPGLLWLDRGLNYWSESPATGGQSCASCHGAPESAMAGVATRYPQYRKERGALIDLQQQINLCRTQRQNLAPAAYESDELLSLAVLIGHQSRGQPFNVTIDGPAREFFAAGEAYFYQRRGQMNLACHHCHEFNAGRMLRGDRLSQGHGNGYPAYRLEWQGVGSLHRRLRFCNQGVRAQQHPYGAAEYVNLALFLAWRSGQLPIETPAVRR